MKIDINSDMGEGFGPYTLADDEALMAQISSANVACGYHAGDPVIMDRTVGLALDHGVDLGAHVSFPDRMGFGRRKMDIPLVELEAHVLYQIGALEAFTRRAGHRITHMNPHGALGNLASTDPAIAEAVVNATMSFDPDIAFLVLPSSALEVAAIARGGKVVRLFLADRGYMPNGQLAPRGEPGAVIKDEGEVVARVLGVLRDQKLTCVTGEEIAMPVQSVLVHSDTPGAVALAQRLRQEIIESGGEIIPLTAQLDTK
ncbi:LamB/YcsF family protein [Nitratireductor basaltis]|uniref:5-oxoprolinase subunit A n=1 Tax=Nitratireductor basaltis TaxID=472175 RepID=A0A084U5V3_9HYPH|nr:5-oxoprolinase subunit PxpA [Nitratireductor basaltis]KFB08339.1 LamB/YcsF family protein [Nitratireductor basaltis]